MHPLEWLDRNCSGVQRLDIEWTAARYDFPDYVIEYIRNNWVLLHHRNGGCYIRPANDDFWSYTSSPRRCWEH